MINIDNGLSKTKADSLYVNIPGDTMTGDLSITSTGTSYFYGDLQVEGELEVVKTGDNENNIVYGYHSATLLQDGSASTGADESFNNLYEAVKITASASHAMRAISVKLKRTGTITNTAKSIFGEIWTNVDGKPGALIDGSNYIYYGYLTTSYQECQFYISESLVSGTNYWFVLRQEEAPAGGTVEIDSVASGTALHAYSANGSSWTTEDSKTLWFKIYSRTGIGVYGYSQDNDGVKGESVNQIGVRGLSTFDVGLLGYSVTSYGTYSTSISGQGVYGGSTNNIGVQGNSTNHYGVYGTSNSSAHAAIGGLHTTYLGVAGFSTSLYGVYGESSSSAGVVGSSTSGQGGAFAVNPSSTDTVVEVLRVQRTTSGTAANNIGGAIDFYNEDTAGNAEQSSRIASFLTTATSGSESSTIGFYNKYNGGSLLEDFRMYKTTAGIDFSIFSSPNSILYVAGGNHHYFYNSAISKYLDIDWSGDDVVLRASGGDFSFDNDNITTSGNNTAANFISNVATGTQPYAATSTTVNTNLNADLVDGIHGVGYSLQAISSVFNPDDATTYYFGGIPLSPLTSATDSKIYIPKAGTIKYVYVNFFNIGLGSDETSTVSIRLNDTSDTSISSSVANNTTIKNVNNTSLSISVVAGDFIEIKWVTPTWATNPTAILISGTIYIE